jgi:hypothetical protein
MYELVLGLGSFLAACTLAILAYRFCYRPNDYAADAPDTTLIDETHLLPAAVR